MVWVGRDLKNHLVPAPMPWAGIPSIKSIFSKPHPTWPWTSRMWHPQLLCPSVSHPHSKNFILISNLNLPSFILKPFQNIKLKMCFLVPTEPGASSGAQELGNGNFPTSLADLHIARVWWEKMFSIWERFFIFHFRSEKHLWKSLVCSSGEEGTRSLGCG